ncbi:MAG: hypothetical protein HC890_14490 [Chloroflexaceae bacterium]|nr:hypothetical protein [Chloroflexaceae bacterium]
MPGDFNWNSSTETSGSAWSVFTGSGAGQAFDPVNAPGNWRDNSAFLRWHTNDPGAALDDRFDVQLISGELFDGVGLDYVPGSYRVVGNNGTHLLNQPITTGNGASSSVLSALSRFSDHLPVIADYHVNWSSLTGASTTSVPEPSLTVVVLGLVTVGFSRRKRDHL